MVIARGGLRSYNPKSRNQPIASRQSPHSADDSDKSNDSDDDDNDDDDDDIPRKTTRPSSSHSNRAPVSLGRPTSKQPEQAGRTTRSGRTSLPLQTHEPTEQPSKRRKTVHGEDVYAIPNSPPPAPNSGSPEEADRANSEDSEQSLRLKRVHHFLGGAKSVEQQSDGERKAGNVLEREGEVELDATAERQHSQEMVAEVEEVGQKVEEPPVQSQGADESLFVPQEVPHDGQDGINEDDENHNLRDDIINDDSEDPNHGEPTMVDGVSSGDGPLSKTTEEAGPEVPDDDEGSAIMDGVEDYILEDFEDEEPPSAHRFWRDLDHFNLHHQEDETFVVSFTAPPEHSFEDAHMKFEQFRLAVLRMKDEGWTGYMGANWVNQPMHTYFEPVTTPGKALFSLVRKFESLCAAIPQAPNLRSQTKFLQEHESIISYYLSQLVSILHHINYVRLDPSKAGERESSTTTERRQTIMDEAFKVHVPLLLHCSHVMWKLAGREDKNCFTAGTLDLLEFFLQAARGECEALNRLLRPSSKKPKPASQLDPLRTRRREQTKKVHETLVYAINNIESTREALAQEGEKRVIRQQKQAKLREQLERDRQATQAQLDEIASKRASMPSTQATTTASSQPRRLQRSATSQPMQKRPREQPLGGSQKSGQREQPQRQVDLAQRSREPFSSPLRQAYEGRYRAWNLEEQNLLLREIKKAFIATRDKPQLPDVDGYIRKELNRPISDILHQTEALLTLMLKKTNVVKDEVELEVWVQRVMSTYDGVGRLPRVQGNGRDDDVFGRE